jgi:hypothetical protein
MPHENHTLILWGRKRNPHHQPMSSQVENLQKKFLFITTSLFLFQVFLTSTNSLLAKIVSLFLFPSSKPFFA